MVTKTRPDPSRYRTLRLPPKRTCADRYRYRELCKLRAWYYAVLATDNRGRAYRLISPKVASLTNEWGGWRRSYAYRATTYDGYDFSGYGSLPDGGLDALKALARKLYRHLRKET